MERRWSFEVSIEKVIGYDYLDLERGSGIEEYSVNRLILEWEYM